MKNFKAYYSVEGFGLETSIIRARDKMVAESMIKEKLKDKKLHGGIIIKEMDWISSLFKSARFIKEKEQEKALD